MMDAALSWLVKWLIMVPCNLLTVTRWYKFRLIRHGPERTALLAIWHANTRTTKPGIFCRKHPADHPEWPAYIRTLKIGYVIYVDTALQGSAHSTVHEVLHLLLTEEGYPWPILPEHALAPDPSERSNWISGLLNALHHPEIFRRMEHVYHFPMDAYWQRTSQQTIAMIQAWAADPDLAPGDRLTAIMFIFSAAFLPAAVAGPILDAFLAGFPVEHAVCIQIRERAEEEHASIHDREGMQQIGLIVRDLCLAYCEHQHLNPRYDQALEAMTFQSLDKMPLPEFADLV